MAFYPVFFNLSGRRVLVAGAGRVALRKVRGLVEAGAQVTVVAPDFLREFEKLPVKRLRRRFRPADLDGAFLTYAATDDRSVNHAVAEAARRRGIPVNVADAPDECDFILPARIRRGDLQIAVSTSGHSPRLAVALRKRLAAVLRAAPLY